MNKRKHNWDRYDVTHQNESKKSKFYGGYEQSSAPFILFHFILIIFYDHDDEILCHPMLVRSPWVVQKHSTQCCLSVCNSLSLCCVMFFCFLFLLWLLILVSWVGGTLSPHQRRDKWLQNSGWCIGGKLNWRIMIIYTY